MQGIDLDELFGGGFHGVPATDEPCEAGEVKIVHDFRVQELPVRVCRVGVSFGGVLTAVPMPAIHPDWRVPADEEIRRVMPEVLCPRPSQVSVRPGA